LGDLHHHFPLNKQAAVCLFSLLCFWPSPIWCSDFIMLDERH
jgi:hypothetical protein